MLFHSTLGSDCSSASPQSPAAASTPQPNLNTEPIVARCSCGAGFKAPPHLAGKQVACPQCQQPLLVPDPNAQNSGQQDFGLQDLGAPNPFGGAPLDPLGGTDPLGIGSLPTGSTTLQPSTYPTPQSKPKKPRKSYSGSGGFDFGDNTTLVSAIGVFVVFLLILGVGILIPAAGIAFVVLLMIIGWGSLAIGNIWMLIVAFEEDALQGLLILVVPFYGLFYLITRWDSSTRCYLQVGGPIAIVLALFILSVTQAFHAS